MRVSLDKIESEDTRRTSELRPGEIVSHKAVITIDGRPRTFEVFLKARVLARWDASLVHGEGLLEELFRFDASALNKVLAAVAAFRRGQSVDLPLVLVDSTQDLLAANGDGFTL